MEGQDPSVLRGRLGIPDDSETESESADRLAPLGEELTEVKVLGRVIGSDGQRHF
jgi:hypothetical protein